MKNTMKIMVVVMMCLLMAVVVTGCKHKKPVPIPPPSGGNGNNAGGGAGGLNDGLPNVDLDGLLWNEATGLQRVYFDYDKSSLRADAVATLNTNAEKINKAPASVKIQIEGHCDERGTQEYNLALGERRALAVREYLIKQGVAADRLVTISYGKEKPAVDGHNEAAWSKNRRAQFNKSM